MVLKGDDLDVLDRTALRIQERFLALDGVGIIDTNVRDPKREVRVLPKRAVMANIGVTLKCSPGRSAPTSRHRGCRLQAGRPYL